MQTQRWLHFRQAVEPLMQLYQDLPKQPNTFLERPSPSPHPKPQHLLPHIPNLNTTTATSTELSSPHTEVGLATANPGSIPPARLPRSVLQTHSGFTESWPQPKSLNEPQNRDVSPEIIK